MPFTRCPSPSHDNPPDRAFAPGWEPRPEPVPAGPHRRSFFDVIAKVRFAEASVLLMLVNALVARLILRGF